MTRAQAKEQSGRLLQRLRESVLTIDIPDFDRCLELSRPTPYDGDYPGLDISGKSPLWVRRDRRRLPANKKAPGWGRLARVWALAAGLLAAGLVTGGAKAEICPQSGNARIVSINETTRAANINSEDGSESGWIFFGGSFVCGIFVLAYAALKEWR